MHESAIRSRRALSDKVDRSSLTPAQLELLSLLENALRDPRTELVEAALGYAARGWPVLPCCWPNDDGTCGCGMGHKAKEIGKAPLLRDGVHGAATDPAAIKRWWAKWPLANIGVALDPAGLLVLDLDGPEAVEEGLSYGLPPGPASKTGRPGGQHRFYLNPWLGMASATRRGESHRIDIKVSGYACVPPSRHSSGVQYEWAAPLAQVPLLPAPDWVKEYLRAPAGTSVVTLPAVLPTISVDALQISSRARQLILTGSGGNYPSRSEAGFRVICELVAGGHSDGEIASIFSRHPIGEYARERGAGWIAGEIGRARVKADRQKRPLVLHGERADGESASVSRNSRESDLRDEPLHLTDAGNAKRLVRLHGQDLHYCHAWGKWLWWDGHRWAIDETGEVMRRAKDTVRHVYEEAAREGDSKARSAIAEHARHSESENRLRAMIALAQSEPGIPLRPQALDADPWKFNALNGTLDLRTGRLLPQSRSDLITKVAPVAYDGDAQCPWWDAFLQRIFGEDAELISFVQRAVGYALTGVTREQVLFILHGTGANGKTTLIETIHNVFGVYSKHAEFETFLARPRGGPRNDIADLAGARFVSAQELESGARLAESIVKLITGGDSVKARFLYGEHFEFTPQFKLFLSANHRPTIRGTDHAIWRRIKLIPFGVTIPEREQNKDLIERLRDELPGILAWAVRGCLEWQRDGLGSAAAVSGATREYREESDTLEHFLAECCVRGSAEASTAAELYAAYKEWASANGEQVASQTAFGRQLRERGFEKRKSSGRSIWIGIGLGRGEGREGLDGVSRKSLVRESGEKEPQKPSNPPSTIPNGVQDGLSAQGWLGEGREGSGASAF